MQKLIEKNNDIIQNDIIQFTAIMKNDTNDSEEPTAAEKYYRRHLDNISRYQKTHKEKMHSKCKRQYDKMKKDPVKYEQYLQKNREYYAAVIAPRKIEAKKLKMGQNTITQVITPEKLEEKKKKERQEYNKQYYAKRKEKENNNNTV